MNFFTTMPKDESLLIEWLNNKHKNNKHPIDIMAKGNMFGSVDIAKLLTDKEKNYLFVRLIFLTKQDILKAFKINDKEFNELEQKIVSLYKFKDFSELIGYLFMYYINQANDLFERQEYELSKMKQSSELCH